MKTAPDPNPIAEVKIKPSNTERFFSVDRIEVSRVELDCLFLPLKIPSALSLDCRWGLRQDVAT
ncbi:hypothetical protein LOC67_21080 [Stieleria sp. JC731]|uniref:hypothetical protein n=1 Tax=Stieleria sp. JC731 TaxID=2894195 RepID=UPI001E588A07|nr:hypothetical protein [Stieleria sp. JC731]MCC9603050.1 hypothetical protein [Stieleria sp. JC731]